MQVGGAERLVLEELAYLKNDPRFSFELHLVFEKGSFFEIIEELPLPVHVWAAPHKSIRMLKTYWNIMCHLRSGGYNILHCHLLNSIGPLLGKLAGVKVVTTVHSDAKFSLFEQFVMGMSDLALGCGKQVMRNIQSFIPTIKTRQLNNSIRAPQGIQVSRRLLCEKYSIDPDAAIVLTLGRLIRVKGYDVLIDAFRFVLQQVPNAILLIAGDGPEREDLVERIGSYRLRDKIKLLGMIREVNELYEVCNVYVNSSRLEGLPMTIIEAMAHGKSVVATSVGGNPEMVLDGVTGMLVPPDNSEKLSNAIVRMLKNNDFREKANKAAYDLFLHKYSIDRHCEVLADYYRQVLQGMPLPRGGKG
jgi:glycosyltransferase involved in cell wall biosynthesis